MRLAIAALILTTALGGLPLLASDPADEMPPLILERSYTGTFGQVWTATQSAIETLGGLERFADQDSGLVFFSLQEAGRPIIYVNVFVEPVEHGARVYFIAYNWDGRSLEPVEQQFFKTLDQRLSGGDHAGS